MTTPAARILIQVDGRVVCIKIIGRANFTFSIDFKTLVTELSRKDYSRFVIDLTECLLMDSTFLGVLAGFGLKMTGREEANDGSAVELLNPNPRIADLLENLGVLHLFKIVRGPLVVPDAANASTLEPAQASPEDITRACLEAHQTLMAINPVNASRFKDVAQFLADDLKKLENRS